MKIIEMLNKERRTRIDAAYYENIREWHAWWVGYNKSFHSYRESSGDKKITRNMYSLKMAKKICEDWASLLLNEKTQITIDDKVSSDFVLGSDTEQNTGGVFGDNEFWQQGNALVEKAFYSGTGAIVIKIDGMSLKGEHVQKSPNASIRFDYLSAQNIIPLSVKNRQITDVAFVSDIYENGKEYCYLETHELENNQYKITNRYFNKENGELKEAKLPEGVLPVLYTGSDIPLFATITPNIVNTYQNANGLGMSIYAHAIDNLKSVDLAFNNFCRDFQLGGKKVFYSDVLTRTDEEGRKITPDDVMQQLFEVVGDMPLTEKGTSTLMQEYNPTIRVQENKDGLQAQLDYLSFKCGLGTKHYQFNSGTIVTATQYTGDKQELVQNASKHNIIIEKALQKLIKGVLWVGKEVIGLPVNPDASVSVISEDGYLIDTETERARDMLEVNTGLMLPHEYRMKWYGEGEDEAKRALAEVKNDNALMGFE